MEKKRARRRYLTLKVAQKRRDTHLRNHHAGDAGQVDCICELADTYFAKRSISCSCRKRKKGQPRFSIGICGGRDGDRAYIYMRRRQKRALKRAIRLDFDPEGDVIAILSRTMSFGSYPFRGYCFELGNDGIVRR